MPEQTLEERSSVAILATTFVVVFAIMFGSMLFIALGGYVVLFAQTSHMSWDEFARSMTRWADGALLPSVVFALTIAFMFLGAVRWRHVLMPEPTEAERARPLSIAVVAVCGALIAMAVASVVAVASTLLRIPLDGPVAIAIGEYAKNVDAVAGVISPALLIDAANDLLGLGLVLDPLWPHVVLVCAGWMAQFALPFEIYPVSKVGRASLRRLRPFLVFAVLLVSAAIVLDAGLTFIVATFVAPFASMLTGAYDVARKGDAESRQRLFFSAVQLTVPVLACVAILAGRSSG